MTDHENVLCLKGALAPDDLVNSREVETETRPVRARPVQFSIVTDQQTQTRRGPQGVARQRQHPP